jgi:ABC-type ATPase with predicted acetyltransferase domain
MDENRLEEIINNASHTAAQLVREQMQGDFRAFGEGLQAVRDKVNAIDSRLTRVEDKLDVVEILTKNTYKDVQQVKQLVSVHQRKLAKV